MNFNLLPWREQRNQDQIKMLYALACISVILVFTFSLCLHEWLLYAAYPFEQKIIQYQKKYKKLSIQTNPVIKKMDIKQIARILKKYQRNRGLIHLLNRLPFLILGACYLQAFIFHQNQLELRGQCADPQNMDNFIDRLNTSTLLKHVSLKNVTQTNSVGFTIDARLK